MKILLTPKAGYLESDECHKVLWPRLDGKGEGEDMGCSFPSNTLSFPFLCTKPAGSGQTNRHLVKFSPGPFCHACLAVCPN